MSTNTFVVTFDKGTFWVASRLTKEKFPSQIESVAVSPKQSLGQQAEQLFERISSVGKADDPVEVLCHTPLVVIPEKDFHEADAPLLYQFAFSKAFDGQVLAEALPAEGVQLLFGVPQSTLRAFSVQGRSVSFRPALAPLLRVMSRMKSRQKEGRSFFVVLRGEEMDVVAFENSRLTLVNTFEAKTDADRAYYVFNMAQKLRANFSTALFNLWGERSLVEDTATEFAQFASQVRTCSILPFIGDNQEVFTENIPIELQACFF